MAEKALNQKQNKEVKELSGTMVNDVEKALLMESDFKFKVFADRRRGGALSLNHFRKTLNMVHHGFRDTCLRIFEQA